MHTRQSKQFGGMYRSRRADCARRGSAMSRLLLLGAMLAAGVMIGGCSLPERGPAVPVTDTEKALPLGIANARFYADGDPRYMLEAGQQALEREKAALPPGTRLPPANFLAISGGGDNGAF